MTHIPTKRPSRLLVVGFATASLALGCDFGGSTVPATGPDIALDGSRPETGFPADAAARGEAAPEEAGNAVDATSPGAPDAAPSEATDAAPAPPEAAPARDASFGGGAEAAVEAGLDATVNTAADAGQDAAPDTGLGVAPVTLIVTGPFGPEPGIPVAFHDPSGTQLAVVDTDTTGSAAALVPAGSEVTAVFGSPSQASLVTITGVMPGDVLPLVDPTTSSFSATATIRLPDSSPPPGTQSYDFIVGDDCSTNTTFSTTSASVDLNSGCVGPNGLFPVLVLAEGSNNSVLGYSYKLDNPSGVDGGEPPDVALNGSFSTSLGTETVEMTGNLPGNRPVFSSVRQIVDGVSYGQVASAQMAGDGGLQTTFTIEPGFASAVQTEFLTGAGGNAVAIAAREAAPTTSGTHTFDVSELPPAVASWAVDETNAQVPVLSWTFSAPFSRSAAAVVATAAWSAQGGAQNGTWTFMVSSTTASVAPPMLLGPLAAYAPASDASWNDSTRFDAVSGSFWPEYDAIRAVIGTIYVQVWADLEPLVPPLPGPGWMTVSTVVPFEFP